MRIAIVVLAYALGAWLSISTSASSVVLSIGLAFAFCLALGMARLSHVNRRVVRRRFRS